MAVRFWQGTDKDDLRSIWVQNRPLVQAYWPGGLVPDLQASDFLRMAQNGSLRGAVATYAADTGVNVSGVLAVARNVIYQAYRGDEAWIWMIDLTGTAARQVARLKQASRDLFTFWGQQTDASWCIGKYPLAGHPQALAVLDQMTAANGVQPDTTTDPLFRSFVVTPAQLIQGAAGIV